MNGRPVVGLTSVLHKHGHLADRQTQRHALPELSMGWVDPWVGLGWVGLVWVGLGRDFSVFCGLCWVGSTTAKVLRI